MAIICLTPCYWSVLWVAGAPSPGQHQCWSFGLAMLGTLVIMSLISHLISYWSFTDVNYTCYWSNFNSLALHRQDSFSMNIWTYHVWHVRDHVTDQWFGPRWRSIATTVCVLIIMIGIDHIMLLFSDLTDIWQIYFIFTCMPILAHLSMSIQAHPKNAEAVSFVSEWPCNTNLGASLLSSQHAYTVMSCPHSQSSKQQRATPYTHCHRGVSDATNAAAWTLVQSGPMDARMLLLVLWQLWWWELVCWQQQVPFRCQIHVQRPVLYDLCF